MNMKLLPVFAAALALTACASPPPPETRYWEDPTWFDAFKASIDIPYPVIVVKDSWPSGSARVGLDYVDGYVAYVKILRSTGNTDLDQAIVAGLDNTITPDYKAHIPRQLHHFEMDVSLSPSNEDFKTAVRWAVTLKLRSIVKGQRLYPKPNDPLELSFDYQDGKFVGAKVTRSTDNADVDAMAVVAVLGAAGPPPLEVLRGKKVHFSVDFCFVTDLAECTKPGKE
jgi:hypothetical protein